LGRTIQKDRFPDTWFSEQDQCLADVSGALYKCIDQFQFRPTSDQRLFGETHAPPFGSNSRAQGRKQQPDNKTKT
jgi:hypothetical protein